MSLQAVKVCGIVSKHDAILTTRIFREEMPDHMKLMLGMIVWPGSKRSVNISTAQAITQVAVSSSATPVGVFVDESSEEIATACDKIGLSIAQLHGNSCRRAVLSSPLPPTISVVDVVDVAPDGSYDRDPGFSVLGSLWTLYDAKGGGTGRTFDWGRFSLPDSEWFLAGGLNPDNVRGAVQALRPSGLDVASGVASGDGCKKDEQRLRKFFQEALIADNTC